MKRKVGAINNQLEQLCHPALALETCHVTDPLPWRWEMAVPLPSLSLLLPWRSPQLTVPLALSTPFPRQAGLQGLPGLPNTGSAAPPSLPRNSAEEMQEGAAGCETEEPAQQAGAGGPQHFPPEDGRGAAGNPAADRDEALQVSTPGARAEAGRRGTPQVSLFQAPPWVAGLATPHTQPLSWGWSFAVTCSAASLASARVLLW